jgi:hypothetical protein
MGQVVAQWTLSQLRAVGSKHNDSNRVKASAGNHICSQLHRVKTPVPSDFIHQKTGQRDSYVRCCM